MRAGRRLRDRIKAGLHGLFRIGQHFGFDILPRHYYSSIPDLRELGRGDTWRMPSTMISVPGADIEPQVRFLQECCQPFLGRLRGGGIYEQACCENGEAGYGSVDAEFLYCFVSAKRPKRIVQVGAGVSTAVILLAAGEADYRLSLACIDPYPTRYLIQMAEQRRITLIAEKAQDVDLRRLTDLEAGDLLFIDSSHAVRPGSEVNRLILEVLPRLPTGSFVHFHDIYFPYDYQASVLSSLFFAGESTMLHAFLINNPRCSIAVSLSMLHHVCPRRMQEVMPNYRPAVMNYGLYQGDERHGDFPSAAYIYVL